MNLSPMRFKNYVWPHNPRVYEIGFERKMASQHVPFGRSVLQGLGMDHRVLRGEGEFVGPGAYREFQRLATVFYEESPGILVHPVWQTANAWFVSLSVRQEPTEDYVRYAFEFWECYDGYRRGLLTQTPPAAPQQTAPGETKTAGEAWYTVVSGDTLYGIARKNGLELSELVAMNPQIRNINLIYPGDKIKLG